MNPNETDEELAARTAMGAAMRRLGHALVGHRLTIDIATRVATAAGALADNARFGADAEDQVRDGAISTVTVPG